MNKTNSLSPTLRLLLVLASAGIIVVIMQNYANLINSLLISLIIVIAASPVLRGLQRRGVPDQIAFLITILIVILLGAALLLLAIGSLAQLAQSVPEYQAQLEQAMLDLQSTLEKLGISNLDEGFLSEILNPGKILNWAVDFLTGLIGAASDAVVVILIVIFMLVDAVDIPAKVRGLIEEGFGHLKTFREYIIHIRHYLSITTIIGLITGLGDAIFLAIIGVDYPILWGILAFLLSFIPSLGFWLALIPPTILAWLEFGWQGALVVFIGYVVINGVAENVVKPRYMGKGLDLSPGVIVVSLIIWGFILGPWGAILAVPLTMAVKELLLEPDPAMRWLATLLGGWQKEAKKQE
jgi:predicted PurR-regulated permease PerM